MTLPKQENKQKNTPNCIGIIMDGNRRWARTNDLTVFEGHSEGYKKLKEILDVVRDSGIRHAAVYAFSTENWNRSEKEVGNLMKLFSSILENETEKMIEKKVRVMFVGDRSRFSSSMQKMMDEMEQATSKTYEVTLHLLMSYGGHADLIASANACVVSGVSKVTENDFVNSLWSSSVPNIDLIIRTGGEKRLSNFLPWQSAYSELFFSDTMWPDFSENELKKILEDFSKREQRHGH